jgi:hypothetical protein
MLEADGFIAQVEAQKRATLQKHLETLRESFGDEALAKLEAWIAVDVAPNVRVDTREYRVPPVRDVPPAP